MTFAVRAFCVAVAMLLSVAAQSGELTFRHLDLALKVFPEQKRIEGDARLSFTMSSPMESLELELSSLLYVSEIAVDGRRTSWKHEKGELQIRLPRGTGKAFAVRVVYAGFPKIAPRPPWEGGMVWSETKDGTPWIGSSHWGGGCDLLWPCIDEPSCKPAQADLRFTVPARLVAPANGVLVNMTEQDGWRTFHWRARSPQTYGVVLTAGPFSVLETRYASRFGNSFPLRFWYLPGREAEARALFEEFPRIVAFFESRIGPYPFADEKMGVVETPYKGMEHQTINAYGNDFAKSAYGFDTLLHHEFSHEYFGNQMSVSNYDDLWLHEGFASYMQLLYAQHLHGDADYYAMLTTLRAVPCNAQPLVSGRLRSQGEVYASTAGPRTDLYSKGALVLHTLRYLIGDSSFFESIRQLVYGRPDPKPGNFALQFRTTRDYLEIVKATTGTDLGWFFDAYLYRSELPGLREGRSGGKLTLAWEVGRPFPMPLEVSVDGDIVRLPMIGNRGEVSVPDDATVIVDPRSLVLRRSQAIEAYRRWLEAKDTAATDRCSVVP